MTIKEIIFSYLKNHGYDGLTNGAGCSCFLSNLFDDCLLHPEDCEPGYKVQCNQDCGEPMNCIRPEKGREECFPDE